jgi:hypothetical protein
MHTVESAPQAQRTANEVDLLAEIEHARWTVERLVPGCRPG